MTLSVTIEIHRAKTTAPEPEYPMKMILKTQTQTKLLQFPTSCQKILPGDELTIGINFFNSKQREVFNVVQNGLNIN